MTADELAQIIDRIQISILASEGIASTPKSPLNEYRATNITQQLLGVSRQLRQWEAEQRGQSTRLDPDSHLGATEA